MNFENDLRRLFDGLDTEQVDMLLEGNDIVPSSGSAFRTIRCISRSEHRKIMPLRKTAAFAAIIVLAAVMAISAGAVYFFKAHKDSVDMLLGQGAGETIESRGLLDGSTFDSEHYTLTVDTVLCTGEQLAAVVTLEPKDDETLKHIKNLPMLGMSGKNYEAMCSQLSTQGCNVSGGGFSSSFDDNNDPTRLMFFLNLDCSCEEGKSYTANLKISELCLLTVDGAEGYTSRSDEELEQHILGEATINVSKNIDYRRFASADGVELLLCDIGLRCGAYHELNAFKDKPSLTFEYSDGRSNTLNGTDIGNFSYFGTGRFGESYIKAGFARLTDTTNVTAVIIEGVRYEVAEE